MTPNNFDLVRRFSILVSSVVLFTTGVVHAVQPYYFIHTISSYRILDSFMSGLVGLWLPYLQIVLATCLSLRLVEIAATLVSTVLFAVFSIAQVSVLARGMEIDCGCYGFVASGVSPFTVMVPSVLCLACFSCAVFSIRLQKE